MRRLIASAFISLSLVACTTAQVEAPRAPIAASEQAPSTTASLAELVAQVDIPYEQFTLDNGLVTLVHTDRKAPIVGVTVYYRVGSKHEPRGRTGFAHLFEHLMFTGSENVENFDIPLEGAGSTPTNGSTWFDRTNYVETVPTGALDLALMMESDRMGHLLGAVDQEKLDRQRGVVQNEKRQGDNQPYGLTDYVINEGLLPVGHPYRHSTIGSMADLDAAAIPDVRSWFTGNYGPNNVVLVLAGDIDAATARPMVERWFGSIPRGPEVPQVEAGPVTLPSPVSRTMVDQVPLTQITLSWTGPGLTHADAVPLQVGMHILGGLWSSRLDNILVREEELAVSVSAWDQQFEQLSFIQTQIEVAPDVDPAVAEKRLREVIGELVAEGPTEEELQRAATDILSGQIGALERVGGFGGKGATLAESLLYTGNPESYRDELTRVAALTPTDVQAAMERWLTRPEYRLEVIPGERVEDGATMGGWGDEASVAPPPPDPKLPVAAIEQGPPRAFPAVAPVGELTFPSFERAVLANGIEVTLARRTTVPKVVVELDFDAGYAADGPDEAGLHSLMFEMLDDGTVNRSAGEIAAEQERLGASISLGVGQDTSSVTLNTLTANLAPALDLMREIVRLPAYEPDDVEWAKETRLADIEQELASPFGLATRALGPLLYGDQHPYGSVGSLGEAEVIEAITPDMLRAAHSRWLRPDLASITVVGDVTMEELLPKLDEAFGRWPLVRSAPPRKRFDAPVPEARQRIVVIDRPNSPQSVLLLGRVLPITGRDRGTEAIDLASEIIGDGFLSRLNMNIREDKGWSYGAGSTVNRDVGSASFLVYTQVQSDRTADSIRLILEDMRAFPSARPADETEYQRVTDGNIRGMPNRYETNGQVLNALSTNTLFERPDDYQVRLPDIYRSITQDDINAAAATYLQPDDMVIVVVGDRAVIDEQLEGLDLPLEYVDTDTNVNSAE